MAILVTGPIVLLDTLMTVGMTKTVRDGVSFWSWIDCRVPHMTLFCRCSLFALFLGFAATSYHLVAADLSDPADLPSPVTSEKPRNGTSLDDLGDWPVKPSPYRWMEDDPVTPTSPSTVMPFATDVVDLDPNNPLERPGIPFGWFTDLELTAAIAHLSSRQQSENLLNSPFSVPTVPLNWTAMPKFTLGYRRPEGLGEWSASYRFLMTQGSETLSQFGGSAGGNASSNLQLHVLDLDYSLSDLFPNDLCLMPRQTRLTGGVRVAGITDKTTASGGTIANQSGSNTFVGAGPRFAVESLFPLASQKWTFFTKADVAGVIGSDQQSFRQTTVGVGGSSVSASPSASTIGVPVVGVRAGLNWLPNWGRGNVKMSTGYQWERWFEVGTNSSSFNELTIQGPFLRGEVAF